MNGTEFRRKILSALAVIAACLAASVMIAACGSDSDSDGAESGEGASNQSVATAEKLVDEARQPLDTFPGPEEPAGEPPADINVAVVKVVPAPFPNHLAESTEEAAEAAGWTTRVFTANGTPQGMESTMEAALATKPDAMVIAAMPAAFLQGPLKKAKAQDIPVVALSAGLPEGKPVTAWNLINAVGYDAAYAGKVLGSWVVADAPDGAEAIALDSPEFVDIQHASKAFQETVTGAGSAYSIAEVVESPVSDSAGGQAAVERLSSPLRAHENADYMFINSENWANSMLQAVQASGREPKSVTGLGLDGDTSIPLIKEGQPLVIMSSASLTYGWYAIDSLIRDLNDVEQPKYDVPLTLVDSENADQYDTEYVEAKYDVAADWQALWGE